MDDVPEITTPWEIAQAIIDDAFGTDEDAPSWWKEFAADYERKKNLPVRDIPTFKTIEVRHGGFLKTSDNLPAFAIFPSVEVETHYDVDTGVSTGNVQYGMVVAVEADDDVDSGRTLHDAVAIVKQLFEYRTTCAGHAIDFKRTSVDGRGLAVDNAGRTIFVVDLEYVAYGVVLGRAIDPLEIDEPREDPYEEPLPGVPTVQTAELITTTIAEED